MRLDKPYLRNYRNYEKLNIEFSENLVIFLGGNTRGKTSLLESIYVLAMARSHRTGSEQGLVGQIDDQAMIQREITKGSSTLPLEILLPKKGQKTKINHIEQKKLSTYAGRMNIILFASEDLSLVKGSPQVRWKFLDMELGQINPVYLYDLVQYQAILKQRSQCLKQLNGKEQTDLLYLDILSKQLTAFGNKVLKTRTQFVKRLGFWTNSLHQQITHQKEQLKTEYLTAVDSLGAHTQEQIQEQFLALLNQNKKKDLFRGTTAAGPHRDDLSFFINQKSVQTYGSQRQQRTTALGVKLAEIDLIKEGIGEYPILLLDGMMSELDDNHQLHLLEAIGGKVQTFLTTTTLDHVKNKMTVEPEVFYVQQRKLEEEETE